VIYFCIPAHNEEKTVGVVLWKLRQVMAEFPRDYQILVADDASTDRSPGILDPYRRVLPLLILRTKERRGYGATLEMLVRESVRRSRYPRRDVIVVLQADFTDDPDYVTGLLKRIESGADIACGGPVTDAVKRRFAERFARGLARRILHRMDWPENADPLNGLNAYRVMTLKRAIEDLQDGRLLRWNGPAVNAALLKAAAPHARRIDVVEIRCHPERAQRPRRFAALDLIREVRRFASGSDAGGLLPIPGIAPDEVHGDLSVLQDPAANGRGLPADGGQPATRDSARESAGSSRRRERSDSDRPRGPRGQRTRSEESKKPDGRRRPAAGTVRAGQSGEPGTEQRSRREGGGGRNRRPRKPADAEQPTAGQEAATGTAPTDADQGSPPMAGSVVADGSGESEAASHSTRPRRRRGTRGGRNRQGGPPSSASEDSVVPAEGQSSPPPAAPDTEALSDPQDSPEGVAEPSDATAQGVRRRRGRRGGRGRRGPRSVNGTVDAQDQAGADASPEPPITLADGDGS